MSPPFGRSKAYRPEIEYGNSRSWVVVVGLGKQVGAFELYGYQPRTAKDLWWIFVGAHRLFSF